MVKLVWHCAWCTGGESNLPPLPPGQAYTGGICKKHLKELKYERKATNTSLRAGEPERDSLLGQGLPQEEERLLERPPQTAPPTD